MDMQAIFWFGLATAGAAVVLVIITEHLACSRNREQAVLQLRQMLESTAFNPGRPYDLIAMFGYVGPWPPAAGTIMPEDFPESLLRLARQLPKPSQQPTTAINVQAALRTGVDASGNADVPQEFGSIRRGPDGDGFTSRKSPRQNGCPKGVADDRHPLPVGGEAPRDEPTGGQPYSVDRHLSETEVRYADSHLAVGSMVEYVGVISGQQTGVGIPRNPLNHPYGSNPEPDRVTAQRPSGVDDTKDGTDGCAGDGDGSDPVHEPSRSVRFAEAYKQQPEARS